MGQHKPAALMPAHPQGMIDWREYADTPQEFMSKLNSAKMTMATPEEMKRGVVAHFDLSKKGEPNGQSNTSTNEA